MTAKRRPHPKRFMSWKLYKRYYWYEDTSTKKLPFDKIEKNIVTWSQHGPTDNIPVHDTMRGKKGAEVGIFTSDFVPRSRR